MDSNHFGGVIHPKSSLRVSVYLAIAIQLTGCVSIQRSPTNYPAKWNPLQKTAKCSELTGRYNNAGLHAYMIDWSKKPATDPAGLASTLAYWINPYNPQYDDKAIKYIELSVVTDGPGVEVRINHTDNVSSYLIPWGKSLQCINGTVRMEQRRETRGDLGGYGFVKEVLTFGRTSRGSLVVNDETSSEGGGVLIVVPVASGNYGNSWYGWPAYATTAPHSEKKQ